MMKRRFFSEALCEQHRQPAVVARRRLLDPVVAGSAGVCRAALLLWVPVALGLMLPLLPAASARKDHVGNHGAGEQAGRPAAHPGRRSAANGPRYLRLLLWTVLTWSLKLAAFVSVAGYFVDAPMSTLVPGSSPQNQQCAADPGRCRVRQLRGGDGVGQQSERTAGRGAACGAVNLHLFILACTLIFGAWRC